MTLGNSNQKFLIRKKLYSISLTLLFWAGIIGSWQKFYQSLLGPGAITMIIIIVTQYMSSQIGGVVISCLVILFLALRSEINLLSGISIFGVLIWCIFYIFLKPVRQKKHQRFQMIILVLCPVNNGDQDAF